ncbi:unnamed protein product [Bursaphelenchus okinawaensis]|uniref:COX assembly mitochondrial protein n=1 Tax=Bursaphelenchus okinawaensis TaxID=465554 RepID=A0A811LLD0_9BILA|nr:unnamed protein product [Bursaphelenchus okinawaensis]CAG9126264.1 unnamed protein product [Bursaphelenchus okinawaensis]
MSEENPIKLSSFEKEELRSLKEGQIVVGPDGKRYRARKSMLPYESVSGPYGIGDPNDRSLRKIEADVLIPNLMNKQIEKTECRKEVEDLVACMRKEGGAMGLKRCDLPKDILNGCKKDKFHDPAFRHRMTEMYLNDRRNARLTGQTEQARKLAEYRKWKTEHE